MFIIGSLFTNINVHKKVCNKGQKPVFGLHHLQVFYVELFCFVLFRFVLFRFYELFVCGRWNKVSSRPSVCLSLQKEKENLSLLFRLLRSNVKDTLWRTNKYAVLSFFLSFFLSIFLSHFKHHFYHLSSKLYFKNIFSFLELSTRWFLFLLYNMNVIKN